MTIKHDNEKAAEEWANGLIDFFERLVPLTEIEVDRFRQAATKGFLAGCAYRDRWWAERWHKILFEERNLNYAGFNQLYQELDAAAKEILEDKE